MILSTRYRGVWRPNSTAPWRAHKEVHGEKVLVGDNFESEIAAARALSADAIKRRGVVFSYENGDILVPEEYEDAYRAAKMAQAEKERAAAAQAEARLQAVPFPDGADKLDELWNLWSTRSESMKQLARRFFVHEKTVVAELRRMTLERFEELGIKLTADPASAPVMKETHRKR